MDNDRNEQIEQFSGENIDNIVETVEVNHNDSVSHTNDNIHIYVVEQIVDIWSRQHDADINLRKNYAKWLLGALCVDIIAVFAVFVAIGAGCLVFSDETVRFFLCLAHGQLVGMAFVVVKYLFSKDSHVILKDMSEVIGKLRIPSSRPPR